MRTEGKNRQHTTQCKEMESNYKVISSLQIKAIRRKKNFFKDDN